MLNEYTQTYSAKDGFHSSSQDEHSIQDRPESLQDGAKKGVQNLYEGHKLSVGLQGDQLRYTELQAAVYVILTTWVIPSHFSAFYLRQGHGLKQSASTKQLTLVFITGERLTGFQKWKA